MVSLNISGSKKVLLAALVFLLLFTGGAYAAGEIGIILNGSPVSSDVSPFIDQNSRTMVPLRFIGEGIGAYVDWTVGTQKITVKQDGCVIELAIGSFKASVDGKTVQLDTQPVLKGGRTMVPLRFVSEQLGCSVSWNAREQAVYIVSREEVDQKIVVDLTTAKNANIRQGPGTVYPVVSQVSDGSVLTAVSKSGDWYEVLLADNSKGWISATLVKLRNEDGEDEDGDEQDQDNPPGNNYRPPVSSEDTVIIISDVVNLRQGPSAGTTKIGEVYRGQEFVALGQQGDWYRIRTYGTQEGWVAGWLVAFKDAPSLDGRGLPSRGSENAPLFGKTIVIDPGHGSLQQDGSWSDPGAVSPSGFYERDIVTRIAAVAGQVLSDNGATVIYTRKGNTSIDLYGRAAVANNQGADAFVSIHCNSSTNPSTAGTSTFYWAPSDLDYWQQLARKNLASSVQEKLVQVLGRRNIGILQERFVVIRETVMPSILVETAFLSNPEEEQLLLNYDFQRKAGEAIAEGVMEYLGAY